MSKFLDLVGSKLNSEKISLPDDIHYTLRFKENEKSFASLWFRTRGCSYSYTGGCTMCDYFISGEVTEDEMFGYFLEGFQKLEKEPDLIVIMTSGSFFDPVEVPRGVRLRIYEELAKLEKSVIVFESHASTINEEILDECLTYFEAERINIEIGLESADEWIRQYCVNKHITNNQVIATLKTLNKKKIHSIINIVVGIPFLSVRENVENALSSIRWILKNGGGKCSLFPVNIKPYTLVEWLYNRDLYEQLPLWALSDVLLGIRQLFLPRIDINWYKKSPPLVNPLYEKPIIGPDTCDKCYDRVIGHLEDYFLGDMDRTVIMQQLDQIECSCRDSYRENINSEEYLSLDKRVKEYYLYIGRELFGSEWCENNSEYFEIEPYILKEVRRAL